MIARELIDTAQVPGGEELKLYAAYKRLKNFATVVLQKSRLLVYLHLDPGALATLPESTAEPIG